MVGERDLGEGELPAIRSLVPDVGEARLLLEGFAAVGPVRFTQPPRMTVLPRSRTKGVSTVYGFV